jgi:FdhD protein
VKRNIARVSVHTVNNGTESETFDNVSVEEPLEIRLDAFLATEEHLPETDSEAAAEDGNACSVLSKMKSMVRAKHAEQTRSIRSVAITMRTPGNDEELASGFLFTEGIISGYSDIEKIVIDKHNTVTVRLRDQVTARIESMDRHSYVASSCGVCGKRSIAAVMERAQYSIDGGGMPAVSSELINSLPVVLRKAQHDFDSTGGIHASALFDTKGSLLELREDVGRHNALDKLIGAQLSKNKVPLREQILLLSGRASFELIQKSAHAGIPLVAAIGAPSSLAVGLAEKSGITLIGFVRQARFNVYTGAHRVEALTSHTESLCKQHH